MRRGAAARTRRMRRWFVGSGQREAREPDPYHFDWPPPEPCKPGIYTVVLDGYEKLSLRSLGIFPNVLSAGEEPVRQRCLTDGTVQPWGDV